MEDFNTYFGKAIVGKKILITGGTTGIGREIAILLAGMGANCLICGRNQEQIDETLSAIGADHGSCIGLSVDLANGDEIEELFAFVDAQLGGIDVLVNNAALGYGSVLEGKYNDWKYIVSTNLLAYLACCSEAAVRMEEAGTGHIINIGSMSADVREENSSVYVATKSGIQGFTEAFRKEVNAKGIKVSLIEPGAVDTDMQEGTAEEKLQKIANEEMIKAEDIARAVLFCIAQPKGSDIVKLQIRPHLQLI